MTSKQHPQIGREGGNPDKRPGASGFQRDKRKFLQLFREIRARLEEEGPLLSSAIGPLIQESVDLELAGRLGFIADPLVLDQHLLRSITASETASVVGMMRQGRDDGLEQEARIFRSIVWNDPHGSGGGGFTDVGRLGTVVDRWIRAVEDLDEPTEYPQVFRRPRPADVDPRLASDPLWRTLSEAAGSVREDPSFADQSWGVGAGPAWTRKISALAKYEGFAEEIFAVRVEEQGHQVGLLLSRPDEVQTLLPFQDGGRLTSEGLRKFADCLDEWGEARAQLVLRTQEGPREVDTSAAPDPSGDLTSLPPLETRSALWVSSRQANDGVQTETLANHRSQGRRNPDGLSGIDIRGRVWRKQSKYAHVWYLRASLLKNRS